MTGLPEKAEEAHAVDRRWGCADRRYLELLAIFRRVTDAMGHAVTTRELRRHAPEVAERWRGPDLANDTNALVKNKRWLVRAGKRNGAWALVPADAPEALRTVGTTPEQEVLTALAAGVGELGRPLLASEVHRFRPATVRGASHAGFSETRNLLFKLTDPQAGVGGVPPVARLVYRDPSGAVVTVFVDRPRAAAYAAAENVVDGGQGQRGWHALAAQDYTPEALRALPALEHEPWAPGFLPRRQLVIALVERIRRELRVPPSRKDFTWYLAAHATEPLVRALGTKGDTAVAYANALEFTDRQTSPRREGRPYLGVSALRTPLSCPSAVLTAPRVGMAPFSVEERQLAYALDTLLTRTPGAEWTDIAEAEEEQRSGPGGLEDAVRRLLAARRASVAAALLAVAPLTEWLPLLDRLRDVALCRRRWLEVGHPTGQGPAVASRRLVRDLVDEVRAIRRALDDPRLHAAAAAPPPAIIGFGSGIDERNLDWLLAWNPASGALIRRAPRRVPRVSEAAPRVRPLADGLGHVPEMPTCDRVDVLAAAVDEGGGPLAEVLVLDAVGLLGRTLRDTAAVRDAYLAARSAGRQDVARALLVARGLLGEPLALSTLMVELRDAEDLAAAVLAVHLAYLGDSRRVLTEVLRRGAEQRIEAALAAAVRAIDGDEPFRVVDGT